MSKQESQELKGVAILLMLFLHLFSNESDAASCSNLFYIGGVPLVHLMTRMANPVPFYVILSGYGLYATWQKGDKRRWSRLLNLGLHYWLILLFFVLIGAFLVPWKYPGTPYTVIENLTAFNTSYNSEHWFLFPYVLLAVTSPFLFKWCGRKNLFFVLVCILALHGVSHILYIRISDLFMISRNNHFLISGYGERYLYVFMLLYHPILYGSLLLNFLLGALACKNNWFKRCADRSLIKWAWLLLILLCVVRCSIKTGAFHYIYVFVFIWIWQQMMRPKWLNTFLAYMGKHSMNMWLIHSFFCYHIFHDWVYGFRYPILIFCVLLLMSYLSSCIINWIYNRCSGIVEMCIRNKETKIL